MQDHDTVNMSILIDNRNPADNLSVTADMLELRYGDGTLFKYHPNCSGFSDTSKHCGLFTVVKDGNILAELPNSSVISIDLDFVDQYLEANFELHPTQALAIVDSISSDISISIL